MQNMDKVADTRTVCTNRRSSRSSSGGRMQDDEGEFAARGEKKAVSAAAAAPRPNSRERPKMMGSVEQHEPNQQSDDPSRLCRQQRQIEADADRHEEQPKQQAPEGAHGPLDVLAVLGLGQQQAGDERARAPSTAR